MIVPPLPYPMPLPWKIEIAAVIFCLFFSNDEHIKKNIKMLCGYADKLGYDHGKKWKNQLRSYP